VERMVYQWKSWHEVAMMDLQGMDDSSISIPTGFIKEQYCNDGWIAISEDGGGNHFGIDLDPDTKGIVGQVINFGRDEETKYVIAPNLSSFFDFILENIRKGNYTINNEEDEPKFLLMKNPAGYLSSVIHELELPYGLKIEKTAENNGENFNVWFESLDQEWKDILAKKADLKKGFSALADIKELRLIGENMTHIQPLKKMTGLRELVLSGNAISDLEPLIDLKDLKKLYLAKTAVVNFDALMDLKNLAHISFSNTEIKDVEPLTGLTKLKSLNIENSKVTDLETVGNIKSLTELDISKNTFNSFEPLAKLKNLAELNLAKTNVSDLSFIKELKKLNTLKIYETQVTDFSPLASLDKLNMITCSYDYFLKIKDVIPRKINYGIAGLMTDEQKQIWKDYLRSN
jgi:internalin A